MTGNKSSASRTGRIGADRKSSPLLSDGGSGRRRDEENTKGGPTSSGKNKKQLFLGIGTAGIFGVYWVYLNHKDFSWKGFVGNFLGRSTTLAEDLKIIDEVLLKGSNVPLQAKTVGKNQKESVPAHYSELVSAAKSTDPQIQYGAVNSMSKLLTSGRDPPIDFLISCNILPTLVDCLSSPNPALQLDALLSLTRIVAGTSEQTQAVVEAGAVPHFLRLLKSPHENICKNALFALAGIIVDGPKLRDRLINLGVVAPLLNCIQPDTPINFVRTVAYVIAALCLHRGMPPPPETVREILPTLNVLVHHNDTGVRLVTAWAFKNLTEGGKEQIQMVIDSGVLPKLVQLINFGEVEVRQIAVTAIKNILAGADDQRKAVLNCDALSHFHNLLNPKEVTCEWALWVLAGVIVKKLATVQAIIDAKLIPLIVHHLEKGEFQTQKAAAWTVRCLALSRNKEQMAHLIECGVIPPLCNLLNSEDSEVVHKVLVGIHNILLVMSVNQDSRDKVCALINKYGGWDKIKTLQNHENMEISKIAQKLILMNLFSDEVKENAYLMPKADEMLKP